MVPINKLLLPQLRKQQLILYKMKILRILLQIFCISTVFSGCVLMEPVTIQVLNPSKISIPPYVTRIVLINHAVRVGDDTLRARRPDDSLLTAGYFTGLQEKLGASSVFDLVSDTPVLILKTEADRFKGLDTFILRAIADSQQADAAIILENYQVIYDEPVKIHFSSEYGYYGTLSVENSSLWKIYDWHKGKFIDDYLQKDTLFWDAAGSSEEEVIDQMPRLHTAAIQSCYYAGMKYAERIAPFWQDERRYLLVPNNWDFYKAVEYVQQNQWLNAIEIWRRHAYSKNSRLAAMACYNMAIASELFDNLDAALDWAAKSYLIKNKKYVEDYIKLLEKRKKIKLQIQQPVTSVPAETQ
jgi:hypothetical protein